MAMNEPRTLFRAAAIADGQGLHAAPGAVLVEADRIIGSGPPQDIGKPSGCRVIDLPDAVILPGLVNVHSHLDLTHIGPQQFPGDFVSWVDDLRGRRGLNEDDIDRSVRLGVDRSRTGGTAIIGDIAGISSLQPIRTLRDCRMPGVSFLEVFGLAGHQSLALGRIDAAIKYCPLVEYGVRLGLQPHAPYSCGLDVYRAAAATGLPVATHLAETLAEMEFIRTGGGPLADMLKSIGVWDDAIVGHGLHPIDHLLPVLRSAPFIAAHLNYIDDAHLRLLGTTSTTVAYCPRASAYFGHPPHRYREMLQLGINVALGTDSIICLDTPDRLSVLDDMRLLHRRDGVDAAGLLQMATVNGAKALGFDPALVTLAVGGTLGLLAIPFDRRAQSSEGDPLHAILLNDQPPQWVYGPMAPPFH